MDSLDTYESPKDETINNTKKKLKYKDISMEEWMERLEMSPYLVIKKTLKSTTQHYVNIYMENINS